MLAAGLDRNAVAWSNIPDQISGSAGQDAWAMLALASPQPGVEIDTGRISGYKDEDASANLVKTRMLVAGLAGRGRLMQADVARLDPDLGHRPGYTSRCTNATDQAPPHGEAGTVALPAATGIPGPGWR